MDLSQELPRCPHCGQAPTIHRTLAGTPLRPKVAVVCDDCGGYRADRDFFGDGFMWYQSLYEAVSVWSVTAKILGGETEIEPGTPLYYDQSDCSDFQDFLRHHPPNEAPF